MLKEYTLEIIVGLVITLLMVTGFVWVKHDAEAFADYAQRHGCEWTGQTHDDIMFTPMVIDKTTMLIPQVITHYAYACRDGATGWR
jgi:hypothetical protein